MAQLKSWRQRQHYAWLLGLSPSLVVLTLLTLVPAAALLVTSLTPFSLTNPEATFTFSNPLVNYQQLLHDDRFLNSLVTQLKLSVVSVFFQVLIGLLLALLLNGSSRLLNGVRTLLLIPMVLPPIIVALIWKIIYTPDISPLHQILERINLPLNSLIANPDTALWAIVVADVWQWFPWGYGSAIAVVILVGVFILSWLIGRAGWNDDSTAH